LSVGDTPFDLLNSTRKDIPRKPIPLASRQKHFSNLFTQNAYSWQTPYSNNLVRESNKIGEKVNAFNRQHTHTHLFLSTKLIIIKHLICLHLSTIIFLGPFLFMVPLDFFPMRILWVTCLLFPNLDLFLINPFSNQSFCPLILLGQSLSKDNQLFKSSSHVSSSSFFFILLVGANICHPIHHQALNIQRIE
jgi:hypothetical protein